MEKLTVNVDGVDYEVEYREVDKIETYNDYEEDRECEQIKFKYSFFWSIDKKNYYLDLMATKEMKEDVEMFRCFMVNRLQRWIKKSLKGEIV